jgi:sulfur-oxidizing protein SoxY
MKDPHVAAIRATTPLPAPDRRSLLQGGGMLALAGVFGGLLVRPLHATPEEMRTAIEAVTGKAKLNAGRVTIDIPPLVENGNTVPCRVTVDSPMTPADHVKAIHVFNEKNPQPNVISVYLGPRSGKASFSTRIRLSDTQDVTAVAELSDGSFWTASVNVIVTLGACLEDGLI